MSDFSKPEIYDIVYEAIMSALLNVHVASPGIVQTYDDATQTCSVQPAVKRPVPDELGEIVTEELPVIQNVPVFVLGSPKLTVQTGLAKGDSVLLVYLDYSMAAWRNTGQVSEPGDVRQHGPGYPVALPWYRPGGKAGSDAMPTIGATGGPRLKFSASAIEAGDAAQLVAIAQKVDAALSALQTILASFASTQAGASTGPLAALASGFTALGTAMGTWPPAPGTAGSVLKAAP